MLSLLPAWWDWVVVAQSAQNIEDNSNRNAAIIVASITVLGTVLVALIGKWQRKTRTEVKTKVDTALDQNSREHRDNTVHLLEIRRGMDLMLSHQEYQDRQLTEIKADAKKAAVKIDKVEDHMTIQADRLSEVEKAAKETASKVNHLEAEIVEHTGYSDKIRQALLPVLPEEMKEALKDVPQFRSRKKDRP